LRRRLDKWRGKPMLCTSVPASKKTPLIDARLVVNGRHYVPLKRSNRCTLVDEADGGGQAAAVRGLGPNTAAVVNELLP
jgi:hypothetical protein